MELLQAQYKKAGINLLPRSMPYSEYSSLKKKHGHSMNSSTKDLQADVDSYLFAVFHPSSKNNYDGVNDPKLLEAQRREPDPAKRRELIREAVRYLNAESFWGRAIYYRAAHEFWHPYLKKHAPNDENIGSPRVASWLDR
jgi:ABC-type transport system substrate-binding protein